MNQSEIIYNQQSLDIKYLLKLFEQGEQTQNDVLNKDMILLVGPTGSGKTTTVNYLLGHKMFLQKKMKNLEIDGEYYLSEYTVIESSGGFEIGHSKQSHTINLQLAHARDGTYLCDSPGFFDNRGSEIEITNASSLKKFMQNCKSVRLVVLIGYHELIAQRGALFQELFRLVARILTNPEKDQFEKMTFLFTKVPEKQTINSIQKEFIDILEIVGNNDEIQNQTLVEFLKVIVKQTKQNGNAIVNPLSGDNDILLNYIMQQKSFSKPSADFCFSVSEASNQKLSLYVQETNNQITKLLQQFQFSRIMDILIQFKQVKDYTEDQFLIDSFIDLQNEIVRSFEKNKNQVFNNFCEASEKSNIFSSQIIQDIIQILKQLRTIDENKGQVFKEGAFKTNENQFKNDIENICSEMSKRIKRDFPQNMESVKTNLQKLRDFTGQTQLGTQSYLQSQQELKVVFEQEKQNLLELSQNFYSNTNQQDIQNIKSNVSQIAQKLQLLKQICLFVKDFVQSENEENFYEAIVKNEQKKNEELVVYLKTQIDYLNQEIQKQPSIDDSQVQFNPKISNLPALQINILKILNQNSSYSECIPECDNNYVKAVGYFNQFFRDAFNLIKENTGDDFHLYKLKDILSTLEEMRNLDMEILGQTFEEFKQIKDEIKQKIQKKAQEAKKLISQHLDELEYINEEDSDDFDDTLSVKSITDLRKSFSQIQKKDFNKLKKIYLFLKNMNWADSYFQSNFTQNTIKKIKQKMENYLEQCSQKISNSLENEKFYLVNFFLWKMKSLSDFKEILEKYQEKNQACIDQVRKTVIEKNKPILDLINIQIQDNTYKNFPWQTINQNIQYLNKVQQLDIISDVKQNSISILNTITAKIQNYYQQNMQKMQQLEKEQVFVTISDYTEYTEFIQNAKFIQIECQDIEKLLKGFSFEKIQELIKKIYEHMVCDYKLKKKSIHNLQEIQETYEAIKKFVDNMYEIHLLKTEFNRLDTPNETIQEIFKKLDNDIKTEDLQNLEQELDLLSQLKSPKDQQLLNKALNKLKDLISNEVQSFGYMFTEHSHNQINLQELRKNLKKTQQIMKLLKTYKIDLYKLSQDCLNKFLQDFNYYKTYQSKNIMSKIKLHKFKEMEQNFVQLSQLHNCLAGFKQIFYQEEFNNPKYSIEQIKEEIQNNIITLHNTDELLQLQKLKQALDEAKKQNTNFEDTFNEESEYCDKKIYLIFNQKLDIVRKKLSSSDNTFKVELETIKKFTQKSEESSNQNIFLSQIKEIEEEIQEESNRKYKEIFNHLQKKENKEAIKLLKQIKTDDKTSFDRLMKSIFQKTQQSINLINEQYPHIEVQQFENNLKTFINHMTLIDKFGTEEEQIEYDSKLNTLLIQIYVKSTQVFDECDKILLSNDESFSLTLLNTLFNHHSFYKIIKEELEETAELKKYKERLQQTLDQFSQGLTKLQKSQQTMKVSMQIDQTLKKTWKKFEAFLRLLKNNSFNFDQSDELKKIKQIGLQIENNEDLKETISNKLKNHLQELETALTNYDFLKVKETIFQIGKYSHLVKELDLEFKDMSQIFKQVDQKVQQITNQAINLVKSSIDYDENLNKLMNNISKADEHLKSIDQFSYQPQMQKVLDELSSKLDNEIQQSQNIIYQGNLQLISQFLKQIQQISEKVSKFTQIVDKKLFEAIEYIKQILGDEIIFELGSMLKQDASGAQIVHKNNQFQSYKIDQLNQLLGKHDVDYILGKICSSEKFNKKEPIDKELKKILKEYYEVYLKKYEQILKDYKYQKEKWNEIVESVKLQSKQINLPQKKTWEEKTLVLNMLAQICAYWTLVDSGEQKKDKKNIFKKPNHTQILSIILLLGIHQESGFWQGFTKFFKSSPNIKIQFQNQLIEILTGEGKSITLGFCSLLLALLGCEVDVVCYSSHLSERDDKDFRKFFVAFGVSEKIKYGTFKEQAERLLQSYLDTRQATLNLIQQENQNYISNSQIAQKMNKILLIDEVDVFFDTDFYGKTYNPVVLFSNKEIEDIIRDIWSKKGQTQQTITLSIFSSQNYKQLIQKFPKFQDMFRRHIQLLAQDVNKVEKHKDSKQYVVRNNKIGYRQNDSTITFSTYQGYLTLFAYFLENSLGNINNESLQNQIGFILNCGHISYALLPKQYLAILGVTGTLQSLNKQLKENLQKYKITREFYIPSMFGESKLDFKQVDYVFAESDQENQYIKIQEISAQAVENRQSVLIFFKDVKELENYHKSNYICFARDNYIVVTDHENQEDFNFQVQKVTRSGKIGLFTKEYGRGTDFVCLDPKVNQVGGIVVIQTFLSQNQTEEIQIKGRTARQGQPGKYYLILNQKDIQQDFQISQVQCAGWKNNQVSKSLFNNLNEKRNIQEDTKYKGLEQNIASAKTSHDETIKYFDDIKSNIDLAIQYVNKNS